jgi:hypothetical protein
MTHLIVAFLLFGWPGVLAVLLLGGGHHHHHHGGSGRCDGD